MQSSKIIHQSLLLSTALIGIVGQGHAAILANFTGGNGTSLVDQYQGIAGAGWDAGWGTSGVTVPTATVANGSPINGSGNYLNVTYSATTDGALGRDFTGTGGLGVDIAQPVTFTLDLRVNTLTGFNSNTDYLSVHATNNNDGASMFNVSGLSSFIIRAYGASPSVGENANEWLLYNGASDGATFNTDNFVNSGMALASGTTYQFIITSDPTTKKYSGSINNGTTSVNWSNLGWRSVAASDKLGFNERVSAGSDLISYSLDNISIVPEPGSLALLGMAALPVLLRRRRVA